MPLEDSRLCASDGQGPPVVSVEAPMIQVSHLQFQPIAREDPASPSSDTPHIPTSTSQVQRLAETNAHTKVPTPIPGTDSIDLVWAEALKIATEKLSSKNLPHDLTNLTSQSAGENIRAVIKALDTFQKDEKKKRWRYTWRGKEVIIVERLGKILKTVESYSKVVVTVIQSNPQVSALVWGGVQAIMQVCI